MWHQALTHRSLHSERTHPIAQPPQNIGAHARLLEFRDKTQSGLQTHTQGACGPDFHVDVRDTIFAYLQQRASAPHFRLHRLFLLTRKLLCIRCNDIRAGAQQVDAHPSLSTATVTHPTHRGLGFVPSGKIAQQLIPERRCCFWVVGASVADPPKELSFGCESLIR